MQLCNHNLLQIASCISCNAQSTICSFKCGLETHTLHQHLITTPQELYRTYEENQKRLTHRMPGYYHQLQEIYLRALKRLQNQKQNSIRQLEIKQKELSQLYSQKRSIIEKFKNKKLNQLKCSDIANVRSLIDKQDYWNNTFTRIVNRFKTISIGLTKKEVDELLKKNQNIIQNCKSKGLISKDTFLQEKLLIEQFKSSLPANSAFIPKLQITKTQPNSDKNIANSQTLSFTKRFLKRIPSESALTQITGLNKNQNQLHPELPKQDHNHQKPNLLKTKQLSERTLFKGNLKPNNATPLLQKQMSIKSIGSTKEVVIKAKPKDIIKDEKK